MTKSVFIPWSGGLDSTYLIYDYLEHGYKVDCGYFKLSNNPTVDKEQQKSIGKNKVYFDKKYYENFKYSGIISEVCLWNIKSIMIPQQFLWLTQLAYVISDEYNEIALGYVMNDDVIGYIEDFKRTWNTFKKYAVPELEKFPKLVFPLQKIGKSRIIEKLPVELFDNIWYCDNPTKAGNPCNKCESCKRHNRELKLLGL